MTPTGARPSTQDDYRHVHRHAAPRLLERYGLTQTLWEYIDLCQTLADSAVQLVSLRYAERDRQIISVHVQGHACRAVWDARCGLIITYLPASRLSYLPESSDQGWANRQRRRQRYTRKNKYGRGA